jgi:hypothetical protein
MRHHRYAQAAAAGGVISVSLGATLDSATAVSIGVTSLTEVGSDGVAVGATNATSSGGLIHSVDVSALSFAAGGTDWVSVSGVTALATTLSAKILNGTADLAVAAYLFQEAGTVQLAGGRESAAVLPGTLKVSIRCVHISPSICSEYTGICVW